MGSHDSFQAKSTLKVGNQNYQYYDLNKAADRLGDISKLPLSLKVLLENLLRHEDGTVVTKADIEAVVEWLKKNQSSHEIAYHPARVLMQDFTGVPAVVDLATMREAISESGHDPKAINPEIPVDLVIDHSVQVDSFANPKAFEFNVTREMERNRERYQFLRWGQEAFQNFSVVPPGTGICHQVNLEYLGKVVWTQKNESEELAYPDTLVGTDSHTTMINGLGILGWGVGGIEAEAAMLGQPISMLIPEVVGFRLEGKLNGGITATDLVLTVTQMLRTKGVVGKFVEFFGSGLAELSLADRATISNMAPEYGATCGFFPVDQETINYLELSGRDQATCELAQQYCKVQGLWHDAQSPEPSFTDVLKLNLSEVQPSLAGPKRPQDRVILSDIPKAFSDALTENSKTEEKDRVFTTSNGDQMKHGDVVIAAITSCTNTSNPSVMIAAGLLAKNAIARGLTRKPWVKSSLAPGSKVVTEYLDRLGLSDSLSEVGFELVGYGCTTCIGNSGPLPEVISETVNSGDMVVSSVLSGNRNFEGRIHPQVKANWLASPPLVVAFALAGNTRVDLTKEPLGQDSEGKDVFLKEIWPNNEEIAAQMTKISKEMFIGQYGDVFKGDDAWQSLSSSSSMTYDWDPDSSYVRFPPFFEDLKDERRIEDIKGANVLALLGDSITTDHISPAGAIKYDSPAGKYLTDLGVKTSEFNSYGSRRGNHEVMMRGTFANIRIRNEMIPEKEGGFTRHIPSGKILPIYDVAMLYQTKRTPLVVIGGQEYGTGSSRDWAAKGTRLLGIKAVIAESFERIHRSNLIGMGVLPLVFPEGVNRKTLGLEGNETINILGLSQEMKPRAKVGIEIHRQDGSIESVECIARIDTVTEMEYFRCGGILHYVLKKKISK